MKITYRVALEIVTHEAIIRQTYRDSVGVNTWSVGLTNATGHDVTRYIGNPQPMEKCLRIFVWALDNYADAVREAFKGVELTEEQFAAALSFHWNTGSIKKAAWVRHFKAGNMSKSREAIMNYSKPPEIIPRREKERDLFFSGKWSQTGRITEYTRLKSNRTPDWKSGKRKNIETDLKQALRNHEAPDPKPKPEPSPKPKRTMEMNPITLLTLAIRFLGIGGIGSGLTACNMLGQKAGDVATDPTTGGGMLLAAVTMFLNEVKPGGALNGWFSKFLPNASKQIDEGKDNR